VELLALQWKVTLEELKVDPGAGLSICAGPLPGVGVGVGVGVCVGWKVRYRGLTPDWKFEGIEAKVVRTPAGVNL
jgi:hypothetical protein